MGFTRLTLFSQSSFKIDLYAIPLLSAKHLEIDSHEYIMSQPPGYGSTSPEHITLDWRISSQRAAELYGSGAKLWTKEYLKDMEEQMSRSRSTKKFSVCRIDGKTVQISNPMFRVRNPIWKPRISFQGYWQLVNNEPTVPTEAYLCPYIVDWNNRTALEFRALIPEPLKVFEEKELIWQQSKTCKDLTDLIRDLICTKTIKKVLCFGLGDFSRTAPEWLRKCDSSWDDNSEIESVAGCMIQHAMALTITQLCRANGMEPLLLAQDPNYSASTAEIITNKGFKIVGPYGAEGFAEIDDESIVISVFPSVPVKQIIADLARPAIIIASGFSVFNEHHMPFADADSPRTEQMWLDYDSRSLPIHEEETEISSALERLFVRGRR